MQALILAAGRGSRMGSKTAERPKCLLEVGGRPLIEHQLEVLADSGVGPVGLVVGYCADEIREVVGIRAEYIENARWRSTNSLYSFWLARDWVRGPVMVLNSDILLDPRIVERLLAAREDAIAFDSSSGAGAEAMKVEVEKGRLVAMGKSLPAGRRAGENVGILRLSGSTATAMFEKAQAIIDDCGEQSWLSAAWCEVAAQREVGAVDVAGLPWAEIDFPYDLDRARKQVWPTIQSDARRRRWPWRLARALSAAAAVVLLAFAVNAVWLEPRSESWESVELRDLEPVQISAGERRETWWRLDAGGAAELALVGPGRVRIKSRLLLDDPALHGSRYALQVDLGGTALGWDDHSAHPSGSWRYGETTLSKLRDLRFDLGDGLQPLRIRLVSVDGQTCLIRLQRSESEVPAD